MGESMGGFLEVACPACGEETFVKREPIYDGFKKVGEKRVCASCGHEFADEEEIPLGAPKKPSIFSDDDGPEILNIFGEDEKQKCCRYCKHYIVNPFLQRCGFHEKEIEATDLCDDFERLEEEETEE
jgi:ribosomal protein S27E